MTTTPPKAPLRVQAVLGLIEIYNSGLSLLDARPAGPATCPELNDIRERSKVRNDINDHLETLFHDAVAAKPRSIVELGVRTGESTYVLERAAKFLGNIPLISIDIDDCSKVSQYKNWHFIQSDDIVLAGKFQAWCRERGLPDTIDFLFIDTSHIYEHTVQELKHWLPFTSENARVSFHDTNQQRIYKRRDGSRGLGWQNRGVIAAIETHFGKKFYEQHDFSDVVSGWLMRHQASCNGYTLLTKLPSAK